MNSIAIVGRLARDPEARTANSGTSLANFSVAVDGWDAAAKERKATFFRVTAFGKNAEYVVQYGHKGGAVAVHGQMQERRYTDRDGNEKYSWEIAADRVELVGGGRAQEQEETW